MIDRAVLNCRNGGADVQTHNWTDLPSEWPSGGARLDKSRWLDRPKSLDYRVRVYTNWSVRLVKHPSILGIWDRAR